VGCALLVLAAGALVGDALPRFAIARIVVHGDLVHNNAVTLRANVAPRLAGNFFTWTCVQRARRSSRCPGCARRLVRREYPGLLHVSCKSTTLWRTGARSRLGAGQQPGRSISRRTWAMSSRKTCRACRAPRAVRKRCWPCTACCSRCLSRWAGAGGAGAERARRLARQLDNAVVELGGGTSKSWCSARAALCPHADTGGGAIPARVDALESADLRHVGGYALKLGVTTTAGVEAPPPCAGEPEAMRMQKRTMKGRN
jgi:cell division protein FtsQ